MAYIYDMTDTWNSLVTTYTAIKMNVTDTASATLSLLMDLQVGGSSKAGVVKDGSAFGDLGFWKSAATSYNGSNYYGMAFASSNIDFYTPNYSAIAPAVRVGSHLSYSATFGLGIAFSPTGAATSPDLFLYRDAANTLAQRNETNAQTFNIYETYTDSSNYRRAAFTMSSGTLIIAPEGYGTGGTDFNTVISAGFGTGYVYIRTSNTLRWKFDPSGHLITQTDNTYDIGASGGNKPRDLYLGGAITAVGLISTSSDVRAGAANYLYWNGRSQMSSPADGNILFQDIAAATFGRLQFGGTTASFPALARDNNGIQFQTADGATTGTWYKSTVVTLASLSASIATAASAGAGAMAYISDASVPVAFTTVAGGGTTPCPVYSDGTQWRAA